MKILQFLIYIPVCLLILSACDKNEDNENGGQPGTEAPKPEQLDIIPVHTITYNEYDYSEMSSYVYENGIMASGYEAYDDVHFTIKRSPLEIIVTYEDYEETYHLRYYNIKTNAFGSITSANMSEQYVYEGEADTSSGSMKAEYNGSGQITKMTATYTYNEDGETSTESNQFVFQYENGNLVKEIDYYNGEAAQTMIFKYDNNNLYKNTGVFLTELCLDFPFMYYAGLWGKPSKNIPNSYSYVYDGDYDDSESIYVEYDEQDRVSLMDESGSTCRFGYQPVSFVNNRSTQQTVKKHSPRLQKLFRRK